MGPEQEGPSSTLKTSKLRSFVTSLVANTFRHRQRVHDVEVGGSKTRSRSPLIRTFPLVPRSLRAPQVRPHKGSDARNVLGFGTYI
jgi:hypothetical protein